MTRSPAPPPAAPAGPRLCPTCGTRVGTAATKCLVCGTDLTAASPATTGGRKPSASGSVALPQVSVPAPVIFGFVILLVVMGVGLVLMASGVLEPMLKPSTPTPTATATFPPTLTPTETPTETPLPTITPLPPIDYTVVGGDTCVGLAFRYKITVQSIIDTNNLNVGCILSVGMVLKLPQPTPTPTPLPSATLPAGLPTTEPRVTYVIHPGDTCAGIAKFYNVNIGKLMEVNGLPDCERIFAGQTLIIPNEQIPTAGPSPTATQPPPYLAPNPLLPIDGQAFVGGDVVSLQWTSVGTLRSNEAYQVTVEDLTCNCASIRKFQTTETKWILSPDLKPKDALPHTYRWQVSVVRQKAAAAGGQNYDVAGALSAPRVFAWYVGGTPAP